MKHLKIYEGFKNKKELEDEIELRKTLDKFIPESFIIFTHRRFDWTKKTDCNSLILASIKSVDLSDNELYVQVLIKDFLTDCDDFNTTGSRYTTISDFKIDNYFKSLFTSTSLKIAKYQFDLLKSKQPYCDWEMKKDANKYNL